MVKVLPPPPMRPIKPAAVGGKGDRLTVVCLSVYGEWRVVGREERCQKREKKNKEGERVTEKIGIGEGFQ